MFCVKILRVASYEILEVFHSGFGVSDQGVQLIFKLANLRHFLIWFWSVFFTKFPMKAASKGFEQNLQRHKESERDKEVQKFKHICELNRLIFVRCSLGLISPSAGVSGKIRPSWQCEHFMAEKYVPNSVTSEHLGHLQTHFFWLFSCVAAPALEVPFLLDTLLSL